MILIALAAAAIAGHAGVPLEPSKWPKTIQGALGVDRHFGTAICPEPKTAAPPEWIWTCGTDGVARLESGKVWEIKPTDTHYQAPVWYEDPAWPQKTWGGKK